MSTALINADTMQTIMERATIYEAGNGVVDCLVHFSRLVSGEETSEELDDILDVDLDNCSPNYAKHFRRTWALITRKLNAIIEDQS